MFPIRDHNPSERTPYVCYTLIAMNIAIWLAGLLWFSTPGALEQLYLDYALIPARFSAGEGMLTLISSAFLHAGFLHLAGNMLFLWIFGDNIEDELGHLGFLLFYLASAIGAGLSQMAIDPGSYIPMVGASGAIAGVMGGYLLLFPRARVDILILLIIIIRVFPLPAWIMLGLWFGIQLIGGLGTDPANGGVAYWAHAGGFVVGILLMVVPWLRRGGPSYWHINHGHPPHPEAPAITGRTRIPRVKRK